MQEDTANGDSVCGGDTCLAAKFVNSETSEEASKDDAEEGSSLPPQLPVGVHHIVAFVRDSEVPAELNNTHDNTTRKGVEAEGHAEHEHVETCRTRQTLAKLLCDQ